MRKREREKMSIKRITKRVYLYKWKKKWKDAQIQSPYVCHELVCRPIYKPKIEKKVFSLVKTKIVSNNNDDVRKTDCALVSSSATITYR
jgi:hypothetical protein